MIFKHFRRHQKSEATTDHEPRFHNRRCTRLTSAKTGTILYVFQIPLLLARHISDHFLQRITLRGAGVGVSAFVYGCIFHPNQQKRHCLLIFRNPQQLPVLFLLFPVHHHCGLLKQRYLHIDETHVQVLKEPGRKNTSDSYMWVYCSIKDSVTPIRYFEYRPGRSGKYPEAFLRGYEGYIHTDAYSGYNAVSGVKRCLCYTHLRRAFVDALPKDIHTPEASKPAEAIFRLNQLFNIEAELEALSPDQKKNERLIREKPLLEAFWSWAEKSAIGELPKSKLSKAFHYALNNREGFFHYLEDGNCSISNSLAENCIRPFVIGRKNWLFSGSPKGAEASAGIYTLVETAKANGLAPMKYIKYILSDIPGSAFLEHPEYLDDYLPWNPLVKEFCR